MEGHALHNWLAFVARVRFELDPWIICVRAFLIAACEIAAICWLEG